MKWVFVVAFLFSGLTSAEEPMVEIKSVPQHFVKDIKVASQNGNSGEMDATKTVILGKIGNNSVTLHGRVMSAIMIQYANDTDKEVLHIVARSKNGDLWNIFIVAPGERGKEKSHAYITIGPGIESADEPDSEHSSYGWVLK